MAHDLNALSKALGGLLDDLEPVQVAIGLEAKDTAHQHIESAVGPDRRMSGIRSNARLSAGFDLGRPVILNLRPKGLMLLADEGRKRTTRIAPKRRRRTTSGRPTALGTPHGAFANTVSRPSRGRNFLRPMENDLPRRTTRAAEKAVEALIRKQFN
jgi:hypothetical protein